MLAAESDSDRALLKAMSLGVWHCHLPSSDNNYNSYSYFSCVCVFVCGMCVNVCMCV